jgi:hypothetical protein
LVIWVSSLFSLLLFFFCSSCSCIGVDNALIKGEIVNIRLTSTHVCSFCVMSDCQCDPQNRLSGD